MQLQLGDESGTVYTIEDDRLPGSFPSKEDYFFIIDPITTQVSKKESYTKYYALFFDGVQKITVNSQVNMTEDTSSQKGYNYVNNAQDQPTEITVQIMESDVFTNTSTFEGDGVSWTRSKSTFDYLSNLRQARRKVWLVIPLYGVYQEMVLKTLVGSIDDKAAVGWSGTLTFREYMVIKKTSSRSSSSGASTDNRSMFARYLGNSVI